MNRRRLSDLYRKGRELTFDDGEGPVIVWLAKVSPVDEEEVVRKANAKRARLLTYRSDPDSEEFLSALNDAYDFGDRALLVEYLIQPDLRKRTQALEAELADAEEWSKDSYLQGLRDAWEGDDDSPGLKDRYAADPEDQEAGRVLAELKRFRDQVNDRLDPELDELRHGYDDEPDHKLRERFAIRFLETRADLAWVSEYRRAQLYLAVRDAKQRKVRYFENRAELDSIEDEILLPLIDAYEGLMVEIQEGKVSRPTPDSSPSSAPPAEAGTEPSSGPTAATP